jgi:hypothetical protein
MANQARALTIEGRGDSAPRPTAGTSRHRPAGAGRSRPLAHCSTPRPGWSRAGCTGHCTYPGCKTHCTRWQCTDNSPELAQTGDRTPPRGTRYPDNKSRTPRPESHLHTDGCPPRGRDTSRSGRSGRRRDPGRCASNLRRRSTVGRSCCRHRDATHRQDRHRSLPGRCDRLHNHCRRSRSGRTGTCRGIRAGQQDTVEAETRCRPYSRP